MESDIVGTESSENLLEILEKESRNSLDAVVKKLFKFLPVINYNKIHFEDKTLGNPITAALED